MVVSVTDRPERNGSLEGDREQDRVGLSSDRYREIFIGSRDGFVMVDTAGCIVDANDAFCIMVGYNLDELRALRDFYAITPPRWHVWERTSIWNDPFIIGSGWNCMFHAYIHWTQGSVMLSHHDFALFTSTDVAAFIAITPPVAVEGTPCAGSSPPAISGMDDSSSANPLASCKIETSSAAADGVE